MSSESRPVAALGALLLARKGAASPAIKAQVGSFGSSDLIGELEAIEYDHQAEQPFALHGEPEIVRQQEALASRILQIGTLQPAKAAAPEPVQQQAQKPIRKAAFTLRLDPQRHLRLKLASALEGISAQQLVTKALDQLLNEMPQVETLAQQMKHK